MKKAKSAKRPHVICHMVPSIDGRIVTKHWKLGSALTDEYERTAKTFAADAWIIGRISMEGYVGKGRISPKKTRKIPREDFVVRSPAKSFAIAIDPAGKLAWQKNSIDDEHVITILTENVSDAYLVHLQAKGVSYLFGGKSEIDLKRVLSKLKKHFAIETLLLEGGGKINGTFLDAGLIDELSVLVAPVTDGTIGAPALFDANDGKGKKRTARKWKLVSAEKRNGDLVWLRYARS